MKASVVIRDAGGAELLRCPLEAVPVRWSVSSVDGVLAAAAWLLGWFMLGAIAKAGLHVRDVDGWVATLEAEHHAPIPMVHIELTGGGQVVEAPGVEQRLAELGLPPRPPRRAESQAPPERGPDD